MLSNRLSCNIYNLLIASCKTDWQPLTANWAVVDCLSITSPVINVASVMLVLPLSGRRAICFCFHQGNQRPRCPPGFPAQTLVIPPTEGTFNPRGGAESGCPTGCGLGPPWRAPRSPGLQFSRVTTRWQWLLVLHPCARAGSAPAQFPRAGQARPALRLSPRAGGPPVTRRRGAKARLFTPWGSHATRCPSSGKPCLSFPLYACLLLWTFPNRHKSRENPKLNTSLVFDTIVNIKDRSPGPLVFNQIEHNCFFFKDF